MSKMYLTRTRGFAQIVYEPYTKRKKRIKTQKLEKTVDVSKATS